MMINALLSTFVLCPLHLLLAPTTCVAWGLLLLQGLSFFSLSKLSISLARYVVT